MIKSLFLNPCSYSGNNKKRFKRETLVAYLVPLGIVIITGIVEASASNCSPIKPRFTEISCFFAGNASKALWFYLPIGLSLIFNAYKFVKTVESICAIDAEKRYYTRRSAEGTGCCGLKSGPEMDRFYLFLKHFIGIGLLFIFEVISGALNGHVPNYVWYVTDTLNMLQGFYIFLIFVCNRNVFEAIKKWLKLDKVTAERRSQFFVLLPTSSSRETATTNTNNQ